MLHKRSQAVDARLTAMEATLASLMVPAQAPAKAKPGANEKAKARAEAEPTTTASVPVAKKTTAGSKKDAKPSGGKGWMVVLASSRDAAQARKAQKRLQQQVGRVEIRRARVKGHTVYRLVVPGFSSKQAAQAFSHRLQGKKGLEGAWIGRG
jgi:cell division septation protein DedD